MKQIHKVKTLSLDEAQAQSTHPGKETGVILHKPVNLPILMQVFQSLQDFSKDCSNGGLI